MKNHALVFGLGLILIVFCALPAAAQESLPFPPEPSASVAGRTMQESTMQWRRTPVQLKNPPNILIIMFDDAGFAQADTFGGEIHTPTLSRLAATASPTTSSTRRHVLAHPRLAADGPQPPSRGQRADRRTGQ